MLSVFCNLLHFCYVPLWFSLLLLSPYGHLRVLWVGGYFFKYKWFSDPRFDECVNNTALWINSDLLNSCNCRIVVCNVHNGERMYFVHFLNKKLYMDTTRCLSFLLKLLLESTFKMVMYFAVVTFFSSKRCVLFRLPNMENDTHCRKASRCFPLRQCWNKEGLVDLTKFLG